MGFKFNPLAFSGFDITSAGGGGGVVLAPVATELDLPGSATNGSQIVVLSTDHIYVFDGTTSKWVDTGLTAASFGITPTANGYTLSVDTSGSIVRNKLTLQPADASNPGGVSTTTQTFAGDKTFNDDVVIQGDLTVNGTTTYINTDNLEVEDKEIIINSNGLAGSGGSAGIQIEEAGVITGYAETSADRNSWELKAPNTAGVATITPGALGITLNQSSHDPVSIGAAGSTPNASGASLTGQQLTLQPADATNPGIISTVAQTIAGSKTFNDLLQADGGIEYVPADPTDWAPAPSLVNTALDQLADRFVSQDQVTKEPTGFPNRTDSSLAFSDGSRTFTIAPTGASFDVYVKGVKFTISSPQQVTLPNSPGNHYIYYDPSGVLTSTQVLSSSLFQDNALVSIVYWNTDTSLHAYFADERHGLTMDGATHTYLHTVFGARFLSGLALQNFNVNGDGTNNNQAQFTSDSGSLRDEDILVTISAQTQIPVLYRQGQYWRKKTADAFPVIYSGTAGYVGANGLLPYNQFTGGSWQLTEVTNSKYVLVHVFGTNDIENPVVAIQGTSEHNSISDARLAANLEISSLSGMPFAEFVPVGSVIFQTASSYSNTPKATITSVNGGNYVDFRGTQLYTPAGTATTHGLLSGLSNDDHPQYLLADGTRALAGDLNLNNNNINNLADGVLSSDAINKSQLDSASAGLQSEIDALGSLVDSYGALIAGKVDKTGDTMTGDLILSNQSELKLGELSGANTLSLRAPASLAADYTLTLPSDDGINHQFLKTDGSGNLVWEFPKNNAAIYHVSADGRSEYTSVQAAINAAEAASPSFTNPKYIVVHGNFTEDLTISKTGLFLVGEVAQRNFLQKINGSLTINKLVSVPGEVATNSLVYISGLFFSKNADDYISITGSNPQRVLFENCSFYSDSTSIVNITNSGSNSKTSFKNCTIQNALAAAKPPIAISAGWVDVQDCFVSNTASGGTAISATNSALVTVRTSEIDGLVNFTNTSFGSLSVTSITTASGAAINTTSTNLSGVGVSNLGVIVPAATLAVTGTGYFYHTNVINGGLGGGFAATVIAVGLLTEMGSLRLPNRGSLTLSESLANGQNTTKIQAAASIGTDYTLTLPSAVASSANSALVSDTSGNLSYAIIRAASAGDIAETSVTVANNQSVAANITGFSFSNAVVRGFTAQVTIVRNATFAEYTLMGIQKSGSWELVQDYIGDSVGITFSITSAGQIQYTSTNTGFTATVKFRAQTLSV